MATNIFQEQDSEILIGLVAGVGSDTSLIAEIIGKRLKAYTYEVMPIRVSKEILDKFDTSSEKADGEYERIKRAMGIGDRLRKAHQDSVLARAISALIYDKRPTEEGKDEPLPRKRTAYVIHSLKHPQEVKTLRETYGNGFYLIGVYSDSEVRKHNLVEHSRMSETQAQELINRDENGDDHGQHTRDTFQMADFFIDSHGDIEHIRNSIARILDILFGHPHITPTVEEHAMFMAYASSLRSADLSRQIGAVILQGSDIISYGANDCPSPGGGLYWPIYDRDKKAYCDIKGGRDHTNEGDPNKRQIAHIAEVITGDVFKYLSQLDLGEEAMGKIDKEEVSKRIREGDLDDLTEYGRVVHAEMEALLMAARSSVSTKDAVMFCSTMPCHNCAKHIIAAGIKKVYFIEPYPKSKAYELYPKEIKFSHTPLDEDEEVGDSVIFSPFIGVGPRRYAGMFAMKSNYGYELKRKTGGKTVKFVPEEASLRHQMLQHTYLDREAMSFDLFKKIAEGVNQGNGESEGAGEVSIGAVQLPETGDGEQSC